MLVKLVLVNHEIDTNQTRGRIKELDELLALPDSLQREAQSLQQPQQQEAELP